MATFKDNTGYMWTLDITYGDVLAVRAATGAPGSGGSRRIDLLKPHEGTPPTSYVLASDLDLFCDVLQVLLKSQLATAGADGQPLGIPAFVARMGGEALHAANEALFEAWVDFFQQRRQAAQAELILKSRDLQRELNSLAAAQAQAIDAKTEAARAFTSVLKTEPQTGRQTDPEKREPEKTPAASTARSGGSPGY